MKTIVICCSGSFYKDALDLEKELLALGFTVKLPQTAYRIRKEKNFDIDKFKIWVKDSKNRAVKAKLIKNHFSEITKSDAILVLNLKKNEVEGYIGANVLMEIALAFHLDKPVFIYNAISSEAPFNEEIYAMMPVWINRNLKAILTYFQPE